MSNGTNTSSASDLTRLQASVELLSERLDRLATRQERLIQVTTSLGRSGLVMASEIRRLSELCKDDAEAIAELRRLQTEFSLRIADVMPDPAAT